MGNVKDMTGRTINPGDWVAYPTGRGSSLELKLMLVEEAGGNRISGRVAERHWEYGSEFRMSARGRSVVALDRCVVVDPGQDLLDQVAKGA